MTIGSNTANYALHANQDKKKIITVFAMKPKKNIKIRKEYLSS